MKPSQLTCLLLIAASLLTGCGKTVKDSSQLHVTATFYPVADITRQIGGDKVVVETLLPTGADLHHFMPTIAQVKQLNRAHLVLCLGHGADAYLDNMMKSVDNPDTKLIEVSKGVKLLPYDASSNEHGAHSETADHHHDAGSNDPHFWLSIANIKVITENICDTLSAQAPGDKSYFEHRRDEMLKTILSLQDQAKQLKTSKKHVNYIAVHSAFRYINDELGLVQTGVFEPKPGVETSARQLRTLIDDAKRMNVKCIFVAEEEQHKLANTIAGDIGLPIYTLDVCTQPKSPNDPGLLPRMQQNLNTIRKAMQ